MNGFIQESDAEIIRGDLDTHTDPHVLIDGKRYTLKAAYELAEFLIQNIETKTVVKYNIA